MVAFQEGGWGYSRFQVTGMIEWDQKSHAKFLSLKNLRKGKQVWLYFNLRTTWLRYTGTTTNLQIVVNSQKNPFLHQATQKNTCQILLPKKHPGIKNFKPKIILPSSLSFEIQNTPWGCI